MPDQTYRFYREANPPPAGFLSPADASTDANNAIARWCRNGSGRSFTVISQTDDILVANLRFDENDRDAGPHLHAEIDPLGITKAMV